MPAGWFLIRVWCRDCGGGEDPQGCFDGGYELVGNGSEDHGFGAPIPFATFDEAEAHGYKITRGPPWDFEVTDGEGKSVETPR
jgi:hypothetical protein